MSSAVYQSKIATIILNYFNAALTRSCCDSIREELNTHFFIVENSVDANERKKLLNVISPFIKDVTLLMPEKNLGFAAGVNLGIKKALQMGFEHFFIINNDATLKSGSGIALEKAFLHYKGSLMSPRIYWNDKLIGGRFYHKYTGIMFDYDSNKDFLSKYGAMLGFFFYLTGCALAFDKLLLEKVGFLNEDFFMYGEDVEYSWRTYKVGGNLVVLDNVFVEHKGSQSTNKNSFFYEYHIIKSHFLLNKKIAKNFIERYSFFLSKSLFLFFRSILHVFQLKSLHPIKAFILAIKI